ncbi:hypothetical protein [Bradyrhizobium sp. HKCCYLR1023]|uniref:NACHT domain-containing protein n=1 Tax=Bradyrhizobium TaxID=374 RepID=UPI003EBD6DE5
MPEFYIHRKLHRGDKLVMDTELFGQSGIFVVLAEPGAGKSDLLDFLSKSYEVLRQPASQFVHEAPAIKSVLVIDSLDEVARIGEEKINEIIVKARASTATTVILASRSYVWDQARTTAVRDCFGVEPTILRLEPFDDDEQRQLFTNYLPSQDFEAFRTEATRFELSPILGNPQFLKLFADAYVQGGRRFSSKKQIYADAVRRLASERTNAPGATARPEIDAIVAAASEIFAKLLLSGAVGVSANEEIEGYAYPYLRSIAPNAKIADVALNTRLFKPTDTVNRHDPVHRIVAEYCAADYLTKRIEDASNTFSLRRCLSVVAPNSTVRNELRGLLGWMASLGNRNTQETIIKLDPYAVVANGDASQLHSSVKPLLLAGLKGLAENDPFFRRMDSWRKFNVAGFFSADMIAHVRPILSGNNSKTHLRGLMLELLCDTEAGRGLESEFRAILLDPRAEEHDRDQAYQNIAAISKSGLVNDFNKLVAQSTRDSLDIASRILRDEGIARVGQSRALAFLRAIAALYPENGLRDRRLGSRYFIRRTISTFNLNDTRYLLDGITNNLSCTCGKIKPHRCTCRRGVSKIAGYLLDQYFELMVGPHDPGRIRRWTEHLVFENHKGGNQSKSVDAMSQNPGLRRAIQISMIGGLSDLDQIIDTRVNFFMSSTHSGLSFREGDHDALVDHALAIGNHVLWEHLIVSHNPYVSSEKGPNPTRTRMRAQARTSPELLRIWTRANRAARELSRRDHARLWRSRRYYERKSAERKAGLLANFEANRAQIEAGQHWGWLIALAQRYLNGAHEDDPAINDEQLIETALLNCFGFIAPEIPSIESIAERGCTNASMVLQAACLATFRQTGALIGIPPDMLRAVKAGGIVGSAYQEGEAERFERAIDSLIFSSDAEKIQFITRLVEPQLARPTDAVTNVYMLDQETFANVKGAISIDWLTRYPAMPWHSRETLFGIAAIHADRAKLNALIETRCNDPIDLSVIGIARRKFWLLRHFFFILPTSDARWAEFSADPRAILEIEHYSGRLGRHDARGWPQLNAAQVYRVLDAFVSVWPKVFLPNSWGSGDPPGETAYRFLTDIVFSIGRDDHSNSIPVFDRILADSRFSDFWSSVKSQRAEAVRQQALSDFRPPKPADISHLLDDSRIASVEDMRALLIELLDEFQRRLKGDATNPVEVFYSGEKRVNENKARDRIVDRLQDLFRALNLGVVVEHQMANEKRCDFTASAVIDKSPVILVTELKGQWNPELYTAASVQLAGRYTKYPGAANQGVYLVLWFGCDEKIAGRKDPSITSPALLREEIIRRMPAELAGRIDIYVLDVSRVNTAKRTKNRATKTAKQTGARSAATTKIRTTGTGKIIAKPSASRGKKAISKSSSITAAKKGTKTGGNRAKKFAVKVEKTSVKPAKKSAAKRAKARKVSKTTRSRR